MDGCDEVAMSETLTEIIDECKPEGDKVIDIIPTKNGAHLLTRPFDKMKFSELISKIDTTITMDDIKKEYNHHLIRSMYSLIGWIKYIRFKHRLETERKNITKLLK